MPTYLVVGVDKPMVDIIDKNQLPVMIKCSLLPFRDKIVCDGFIEKVTFTSKHGSYYFQV